MRSIILFSFVILFGNGFCQKALPESKPIREKYQNSLQKAINILKEGKTPEVKLIEFCIPETDKESTIFYSLDQQKENTDAFHILGKKIRELVSAGDKPIFKKYLVMSQFVDGYFAEAYFDDIETIIQKQKELFCKTVNTIPQEKTKRLSEYKTKAGCH